MDAFALVFDDYGALNKFFSRHKTIPFVPYNCYRAHCSDGSWSTLIGRRHLKPAASIRLRTKETNMLIYKSSVISLCSAGIAMVRFLHIVQWIDSSAVLSLLNSTSSSNLCLSPSELVRSYRFHNRETSLRQIPLVANLCDCPSSMRLISIIA